MSSRRMVAIGIVALLHALLGYAFITGLAYNVVKKVAQDLKTFDVEEEPPPPEEAPPPPPPDTPQPEPPPFVPPSIVQAPVSMAPPVQISQAPVMHIEAPTAPPAPPPKPSVASPAKPKGSIGSWVTPDDYPSRALREEQQGVTGIRFDIGADGRVTNCQVTSSSGFPELDAATCGPFTRRARYTPAQDAAGNKMAQTGQSSRIRWQIPKD